MRLRCSWWSAPVLSLSLLACGGGGEDEGADEVGDTGDTEADGTEEAGETGEEPPPNPFAKVVEQGLGDYVGAIDPSEVVEDGAATHYLFDPADGPMCLRGGDYWMSTRAGSHDPKDLLIYLQGGGACWSELCQAFETLGPPAVPDSGMLNRNLADNPFADWNAVYVPYCDGSLFTGDVDIDDDEDGAIDRYHRGLIDLSVALDVALETFPEAERIVLAGSSAGSYGVHISDMLVRTMWPGAELIVVADSGVGIGKPGDSAFIPGLLEEWDSLRLIPDSCPDCVTDHITNLPNWQLSVDPNLRFVAISTYADAIIGGVFLGLGPGEYQAALEQELGKLAADHPGRYTRYLFDSSLHTTIAADSSVEGLPGITANFDQAYVGGVSVAQWLGQAITDDPAFSDQIE